eukprot:IDg22989t1
MTIKLQYPSYIIPVNGTLWKEERKILLKLQCSNKAPGVRAVLRGDVTLAASCCIAIAIAFGRAGTTAIAA